MWVNALWTPVYKQPPCIFRCLLWIFRIVHNFPVIHYLSG